jgi:Urease alpha-subunit, N-terminal domain
MQQTPVDGALLLEVGTWLGHQQGKAVCPTHVGDNMRNCTIDMRLIAISFALLGVAAAQPFDVVIRNGHIIDGSGSPWYSGDIGVRAGRIAAIGQLANAAARKTIDAHGTVVAPGFIDMLGQSRNHNTSEPALAFEDLSRHHD